MFDDSNEPPEAAFCTFSIEETPACGTRGGTKVHTYMPNESKNSLDKVKRQILTSKYPTEPRSYKTSKTDVTFTCKKLSNLNLIAGSRDNNEQKQCHLVQNSIRTYHISVSQISRCVRCTFRSNPPGGTLHALLGKQTNVRIFCRRCADRTQPLIHRCCERIAGR